MDNVFKDFKLFAKDKGLYNSATEDQIKGLKNSLTPVVLEERDLRATAVDVFSRLLMDRQIFFGADVNEDTCNLVVAQLLYLDSLTDDRDISIIINSPGGSVINGLAVIDTMNFIKSDVSTLCCGVAASMGAVLLSNGTKGKRYILPHSRVMIHQVSSWLGGTFSDVKIEFEQMERAKRDVYQVLADNMGKSFEEMETLCDRNNWFIGQEAVDINIVDSVINNKRQ